MLLSGIMDGTPDSPVESLSDRALLEEICRRLRDLDKLRAEFAPVIAGWRRGGAAGAVAGTVGMMRGRKAGL